MGEPANDFERLPFAPGAAPFRIKGLAYRGHCDYVDAHVPGGMRANRAGFQSAALRQFFAQQFLASSWYDVFPLVAAGHVCAQLAGMRFDEFIRVRARFQAEQDIHGVYRLMLKLASAEAIAVRLPRLTAQYFNFGTTDVRVVRAGLVEGVRHGLPALMHAWYAPIVDTYITYALELAGAKNPRTTTYPARVEGAAHGIDVVELRMDFLWD